MNDVKAVLSPSSSKSDPEGNSKAIKIRHIPYGFFEKELVKYFSQFGHVRRVRVARNKKTGNCKGWAFVLFTNHEVAQLAAEAMDGYLMFEKRLQCEVVKNKSFPRCLLKGPRLIRPPVKNATTKRHALKLNRPQSGWNEEAAKDRLLKNLKKRGVKFAELGYQLPPIAGLSELKPALPVPTKSEVVPAKIEEIKEEDVKTEVALSDKPTKEARTAKNAKTSSSKKLTKVMKKGKRKAV